ncbi:hypothetical protein [Nocardia thraciensis]
MRDNAVGLVRADLSENVTDDEKAVRELAEWSDVHPAEGLVFGADTDMPTLRLMETVNRHNATVRHRPDRGAPRRRIPRTEGGGHRGAVHRSRERQGRSGMTKFDWWRDHADTGTGVPEIRARLEREQSAIGWTHEAPDAPLSVEHAHKITQQHRDCTVEGCARKRAAWRALIEAGRATPDIRLERDLQ